MDKDYEEILWVAMKYFCIWLSELWFTKLFSKKRKALYYLTPSFKNKTIKDNEDG